MLTCFVAVFSAGAQPNTSSNRYLFIVDTSAGMKPFDMPLREAVFGLVYSGLRGRMTNGDTYGLWLVNDQNDTSYPMDLWRFKNAMEMGARATKHVKDYGFRGKARLDLALTDAMQVIKNVQDLTVVLVSNGETPISGTPFDDEINATFRDLSPKMKRAKSTVNTALVAQDGKFVAWAVNAPGYLVDVPFVAPKPKPTPTVAAATTNNTPPAAAPAPVTNSPAIGATAASFVPKPRATASPIVITKETVAQERRSYQAMIGAPTNEFAEPSTNAANTSAVATAPTNAPLEPVSNPSIASAIVPTNLPAPTNSVVVAEKETKNDAAAASVPVVPPAATPPAPTRVAASAPVRPETGPNPFVWAAVGAAAALVAVLLIAMFLRSRRHEPSLISQAVAQDRVG